MEIGKSFIVLTTLLTASIQIYVPDDGTNQKPSTNSQGIQTWNYHRPNQIQVDHSYSKVYRHNNRTTSSNSDDDQTDSKRLYPIYNAHAYGSRPPSQVYVINGTKIGRDTNPIRQIVAYNKSKRSPKLQAYKSCPSGVTGQFVYEDSCNQFLNCWKGRGYVQNCAPGTLFNPRTLECDFLEKVTCVSGPRESILPKERHANLQQIGCPKDFSGLIPNYTDCSKFISCVSGIENFMDCPTGTLFDVDKNVCDFAHMATCFNGQNENLKKDVDDQLEVGTNRKTGQLRYKFGEVRCPEGMQGLMKHPGDCTKFLNCANGQTFVQECAPGTLFNPIVKICDFPYNVRCETGTTSHHTSFVNENENENRGGTGGYYQGNKSLNRQGTQGSSWYGSPGNRDQTSTNHGIYDYGTSGHNLHPFDSNTNAYNKGSSNVHYGDHYGGTHDVYNGGRAPSFSGTSDNRYESTNYAKGDSGTNYGNVGYHQIPQYSGTVNQNEGISYNGGTSSGSSSGYFPNSYSTTSGQNLNNEGLGYASSYPSRPNEYVSQNSNIKGTGPYYRPYSTSSSHQNPDLYQPKGHYITRPNRLGVDQYSTTVPYNTGLYDAAHSQYGTSGQNSWSDGTARNENGFIHGTRGSQNNGNIYNPKGSSGTYDQTSWSGTSNLDRNRHTGYGHNTDIYPSRDSYGTKGFSGSYDQNSWTPIRDVDHNRKTYGTKGFGQNSYPDTHTMGDNHGTQSTNGAYGLNSWTETQSVDPNRNIYGTGSDNSWTGTREINPNQNIYVSKGHSAYDTPTFDGNTNHLYNNQRVPDRTQINQNQYPDRVLGSPDESSHNRWYSQTPDDRDGITDPVVHINHHRTTKVPFRNSNDPFFGTTQRTGNDYDDYRPNYSQKFVRSTTPRMEKSWPPPFPSTDVNADYVFEYEDPDVTLEAENSHSGVGPCAKVDFACSNKSCIPKTLVCDGTEDCSDGKDEKNCLGYISKFEVKKNKKLAILEKERWDNVSIAACALMCVQSQKFKCRSFNYRNIDKACFLTNTNEGLTGAIISYSPFHYYELISDKINCTKKFLCPNQKCIEKSQICDGKDDCGDRTDEKHCKSEDFGYSVRLTGSRNKHEGFVEMTAFGKTGFVCDDNFGLNDANVVCKELGYSLGASEVKGNSFFGKGVQNETPFYMMDDITCSGNETRLLDCDFSGWGVHNCLGQEIAGVVCKTTTDKCASDYWKCDTGQECLPLAFVCDGLLDCTDGSDEASQHCDAPTQIRLVNGTNQNQGRVEIRYHGTWGSICDDDFNEDAGKVICKQLGYKGSAVVKKDAFFGSGTGPIWLDQVFCSGNETNVEECSHWNWGEHNCDHSEDVGVICSNTNNYEERHSHKIAEIWKPLQYPERCGYRSDNIFNRNDGVHFRVVKGSLAKKGDYPWQAAIRVKGKTSTSHWCGAVIFSEKFVLTAAHCLIGYAKGAYIIVAGDYNVDEDEGTEQEAHIEDYYLHEDFRQGHKMNNDIALVKLKGRGFSFNDHIQAICLPDSDTSYETEQNCTISGFGSIESGKSAFSHNLRAGWIQLQKREICTMPHVYGDALTEGMICAGSLDEGIDSCDGDSGGPLACLYRGVFTLYGITSWGQHCGYANKPGVYVKVAHYKQWIDDTFKKYS